MYHCGEDGRPRWPPGMVINDYTTGYYAALAVQTCLLRQLRGEGGGFIVSPSLTGTAMSILKYFKAERYPELLQSAQDKALPPEQMKVATKMGLMHTLSPLPKLSLTPIKYDPIFLEPIGSGLPQYPGYEDDYDPNRLEPMLKEKVGAMMGRSMRERLKQLREMGIAALANSRYQDAVDPKL